MALLGLLTLLSLLSPTHGSLTGWWVGVIGGLFGWGVYVLPVALLLVGVWLVFRNFEKVPQLSLERLTGMTLIFSNLLVWMHLAGSWFLEEIPKGQGGGDYRWFLHPCHAKKPGRTGSSDCHPGMAGGGISDDF